MTKKRLPNFLIVGSMKCGTTSLYQYLKQHPEIYLPKVKEPKFFLSSGLLKIDEEPYKFMGKCSSKPYNTFENYLQLFKDVNNQKAVGEASPHYLFAHSIAIPLIKKYLGDNVKIIIILRNPAERAHSAYKHNFINNPISLYKENLSFEKALEREDERFKSETYPMIFYYKRMGLYYEQVKAYKDSFKDVFVCLNNELKSDGELLMKNLYSFLEVDIGFKADIDIKFNESINIKKNIFYNFLKNRNHPVRNNFKKILLPIFGEKQLAQGMNILKKINSTKTGLEFKDRTRKELISYFRNNIIKLEGLIEKDLSNWL